MNKVAVRGNRCDTEHGLTLVMPRSCWRWIEARTTVVEFEVLSNLRKRIEPSKAKSRQVAMMCLHRAGKDAPSAGIQVEMSARLQR